MLITNYYVVAVIFISVLFILNALPATESAVIVRNSLRPTRYPVVYRRYVRRRPPTFPTDEFSEDILEIYHTKAKPPSYNIMTDEEVDLFIFCDFNRHMEKCKYTSVSI